MDKMCELCQKEHSNGTLFGVEVCESCAQSFWKATHGDSVEQARFLNSASFPNATELAKKNIIARIVYVPSAPSKPSQVRTVSNSNVNEELTKKKEFARSAGVNFNDVMGEDTNNSLDGWYADIGCKIKGWAKWIFIIDAILAVLFGIATMVSGENDFSIILGIMILVLGPIFAWILSWLLYGFGELIDKTCATERHTKDILKVMLEINKK